MLCILIVEGMSVVVNVMLSLMSVMSPPPALCSLSVRTAVKLCILGCFGFRGELGFLNCDDVCMCVVNKQFEFLEFVSESVNVDLQYDEISLTSTAGSVCLCGVSSPVVVPWSVCEVVLVPYVVSAVVAVSVMLVLLFVLHVYML